MHHKAGNFYLGVAGPANIKKITHKGNNHRTHWWSLLMTDTWAFVHCFNYI